MSPRNVVFVAYDELTTLDLVGPMDVFDTAGRVAAQDPLRNESYALCIASVGGRSLRSTSGVRMEADVAVERLRRPVDTLVVVSGIGPRAVARSLLETTGLPVERVGEAAGFGSAPTFRRVFRRRLGVGPRTYRDRFAA